MLPPENIGSYFALTLGFSSKAFVALHLLESRLFICKCVLEKIISIETIFCLAGTLGHRTCS